MSSLNNSIGGYFELELRKQAQIRYPEALRYQSARAALLALLQSTSSVNKVWVPYFICDSIIKSIQSAKKEVKFYRINEGMMVRNKISMAPEDLLLYVNYFGVCDANAINILKIYDPLKVIIDCSQAFFSGPYDCLATIYSPRKFLGIPDGGLLITSIDIPPPALEDQGSLLRAQHLLLRMALSAEDGYQSYLSAERSLEALFPRKMSRLTYNLLSSIDLFFVQNKRQENFCFLNQYLKDKNKLEVNFAKCSPMCYPLFLDREVDKGKLAAERIFIPSYWPEVLNRSHEAVFEKELTRRLIALPCDQRYSKVDMERVLATLDNGILS